LSFLLYLTEATKRLLMKNYNRRRFMRDAGMAGIALGLTQWANPAFSNAMAAESG
jgi:hypothetical protein